VCVIHVYDNVYDIRMCLLNRMQNKITSCRKAVNSLHVWQSYKYLGTAPRSRNSIREEIKRGLNSGRVYWDSVQNICYSSLLFKNTTIEIYTTIICCFFCGHVTLSH
jgi:hypothetical protein